MKKTVKWSHNSACGRFCESRRTTLSDTYTCSKHRTQWDTGRAIILWP